jgi:hypothetical protein
MRSSFHSRLGSRDYGQGGSLEVPGDFGLPIGGGWGWTKPGAKSRQRGKTIPFGYPRAKGIHGLGPPKSIAHEREAQWKALGAAFEAVSKESRCELVSLFGGVPDESLLIDGVHPDPDGHAMMAKILIPKILS